MIAIGVCVQFGNFQMFTAFRSPDLTAIGQTVRRKCREVVSGLEWSLRGVLLPPCMA